MRGHCESGRRGFLKALGAFVLSPPGLVQQGQDAATSPPPEDAETKWLTPATEFYVRNHLGVPIINREDWKLVLEGAVARPLEWTYTELQRLSKVSSTVTLECAENLPGGREVGNARWTGVPLATLLEGAGVEAGAREVVLEGADRGLDEHEMVPVSYARSLPLEQARSAETLVALEMNGQPLTPAHGHPARVIVPGWYGMAHVKWLTRIRVVNKAFQGFYMSKRYFTARRHPNTGEHILTPVSRMGIKSQIHYPKEGQVLNPGSCVIKGAAWAGCRPVERVEISIDEGSTWIRARLAKEHAPCAWVHWSHRWEPPSTGGFAVQVRAFDDRGHTQPLAEDLGRINRYDNRWLHRVRFSVSEALVERTGSRSGEFP